MIKVMVVEDELPILRNISNLIESISPLYHVVYQAKNGKEALNILRENDIDLMFLDMQMPVMKGLDLLQELKLLSIQIPIIVLSSFQDFEYVREALRFGALDYMLKPLKKEDLVKVLGKAERELIRSNCIIQKEDGSEAFSETNVGYDMALYCAGSYNIDDFTQTISKNQKHMENELEIFLETKLTKDDYWLIQGKEAQEKLILFRHKKTIQYTVNLLKQHLEQSGNQAIPITIIIYGLPIGMKQIYQIHTKLRSVLRKEMKIHDDILKVYNPEENLQLARKQVIPLPFEEVQFKEQIYPFVYKSIQNCNENRKMILQRLKTSLLFFQKRFPCNFDYVELEDSINSIIQNAYDMNYIYEEIKKIVMEAFYEDLRKNGNKEKLAYTLKDYLDKNYKEHISNQDLADKFGFVPAYLRNIFQQEFEKSPMEYIQYIRIEKSKKWLSTEPNLSLKDIAEALGFSDQLYFSKVFKKMEHMSPTEYRKIHQESGSNPKSV